MRARNKGSNRIPAASLRDLAVRLEKKGPEEFTRREVTALQGLRSRLSQRLLANALAESVQDILDGKTKNKHEC
jgi:hypothetical protein